MRSPVPLELKINVKIGPTTATVTVEAAGDLLETDPTTHTDVDRALFDKLPLESQSSSLSSLVTLASRRASRPIRTVCFTDSAITRRIRFRSTASRLPTSRARFSRIRFLSSAVQSMEVIEGAPPAEYGDKTSLVIVVTTRSGLGIHQPHGDITASYGTFGTSGGAFDLAYGGQDWGNFIS